ncbi:hypothetical protein CH063_03772 [Colletotrichum higginsianum]|uniref:Xylanolytic transcriptional activator regulatory domain-containing protein n=1 Tax=Colletotrichum higginsianum (strain IMI 349063) TaxID=759273 RepID=H1W0N7_COLHI|nr:hypothetical protein CH063_03772 [Colletotrichum higginsianum]
MSSASSGREPSNSVGTPDVSSETPRTRPIACVRCWKRKQKVSSSPSSPFEGTDFGASRPAPYHNFPPIDCSLLIVDSYVESLKKRVAELKHNVQSSSRKRARTENHRAESSADGPLLAEPVSTRAQDAVSVVSSHASARTATRRGHEDSSVRATMGAIGFLSRSAMAEPRGQSDELPRKFSLGEIISGALAIDGRDPSKASPAPKTPTIDGHLLPLTHDATSSHLRRFLDSIVFLPYLDEASLLEQYDIVVANNDRPDRGGRINPLHFFNVHMALAIGILMSPDSAHLSMLSSGYHAVAANQVHSILRSEVSLEHVHCMVMLLLYSLLSSTGGSAWHLLGLTVKTCISLGLHREPDAHADLTMAEANKRRWLFWTVYSLDRYPQRKRMQQFPFSTSQENFI